MILYLIKEIIQLIFAGGMITDSWYQMIAEFHNLLLLYFAEYQVDYLLQQGLTSKNIILLDFKLSGNISWIFT